MKKFVVILICLLTTFFASAQATFLKGSVLEKETGNFPGVMVTIESDGQKISAQTDINGVFLINDLHPGKYRLVLQYAGMREEETEVLIHPGENILELYYPKVCNSKKLCPKGNHTDNIIPVVYGLPTKKMMRKADKGKVYLGGCNLYCEKWYCSEHDISF